MSDVLAQPKRIIKIELTRTRRRILTLIFLSLIKFTPKIGDVKLQRKKPQRKFILVKLHWQFDYI